VTSPDPVWAPGKTRVVVLGPTEEKLTERLKQHLGGLFSRYGFCDGWTPGSGSTDGEIHARLTTADVAVVMVGPGTPIDMMEALQARRPELLVVPVLARQFDMSMTPLRGIVTLPRKGPVSSYPDADAALCDVAGEMREAAKRIQAKRAAAEAVKPAPVDQLKVHYPTVQYPPAPVTPAWDSPAQPPPPWGAPPVPSPPPWSADQARSAGRDAEDFAGAVMSAYDRSALTQVMHYGLGVNLADVVAPGGIRSQVLELHRWLLQAGKLDQFVDEATRRNPADPNLAAYARAHRARAGNRPAWLSAFPPDWPNADFQRFQEALCESYPDDRCVRAFLDRCEVDSGDVSFTGRSRITWHDALRCAASQLKMQAVFDRAVSENPTCFAAWRGGQKQALDREAVYDRLSRMLPSQLSAVALKLGVPQAFLPGPTASNSDHAVAIIRWAESSGMMQRLLDAEASARRAR